MHRRHFVWGLASGVGAGLVLPSCTVNGTYYSWDDIFGGGGGAEGYKVGEEHLVFDEDSPVHMIHPTRHEVRALDASGNPGRPFGSLGEDQGELNFPIAGAVDGKGRLYVVDRGNSRVEVFDAKGRHQDSIGSHGGGNGQLSSPNDLAISEDGRMFVADTGNHRVQVFSPKGEHVRSIGEAGRPGQDLEDLNGPRSVALCKNELHVADSGHARVQVYSFEGKHLRSYGEFGDDEGQLMSASSIVADQGDQIHVADPVAGFIHVFGCDGEFIGRSRPKNDAGEDAVPYRLQMMPDGMVYVWTGGHVLSPW